MFNNNRNVLLHTMVKHETLTIHDVVKEENLGIKLSLNNTQHLLNDLLKDGQIQQLDGVVPVTYTITVKGIEAYNDLSDDDKLRLKESKSKN